MDNSLCRTENTITVFNTETQRMEVLDIHTGNVLMEDGIPSESYHFMPTQKTFEAICGLVREGNSLENISQMDGFPNIHVMYGWKRKFREFKQMILEAREDRADYFMEKAEKEVDSALTAEDARVAKVKFDAYTNLAEKYNRKDYGKPERGDGGSSGPVKIVVHTGINRENPVDYVEVNYGQDEEVKDIGPQQRIEMGGCADRRGTGDSEGGEASKEDEEESEQGQATILGKDNQQEGEF